MSSEEALIDKVVELLYDPLPPRFRERYEQHFYTDEQAELKHLA